MKQHILFRIWKFLLTLARSGLFAILFFAAAAWAKRVTTFGLTMYDFLFVAVIVIQAVLLLTKIETVEELKIILIYHVLWFVMEVFKTHPAIGSWSYPGDGFFKIRNVPLFGGFMYSAIGSFIFQARRLLDLKFVNFPSFKHTIPIAALIYVNFFTHHFIPDFRYVILLLIIIVAWKTRVYFRIYSHYRSMHVLLWLFLTGLCIWFAENIGTYFQVWMYPNQATWRHVVSVQKILSWFLLFIVSIVIVSAWKMKLGKKTDEYVYYPEDTETSK